MTSPRRRGNVQRRGFTLIEVLVVVAIIALLVSVLIPSLAVAREQARSVKCLANYNMLGVASLAYLNANNDVYCWGRCDGNSGMIASNFFGGKRGKGTSDPDLAGYLPGHALDFRAGDRPLNRYVAVTKLGDNADLRVYECPSDKGVASRSVPNDEPTKETAYDVMGTSYDSNVMWNEYAKQVEMATIDDRIKLARSIIRLLRKKGASRAILLQEDPADVALGGIFYGWPLELKIMGWHGKINRHNILFLDGHAAPVWIQPKYNQDYRRGTSSFQVCAPSTLPNPYCANGTGEWVSRHDFMQR